MEKKKKKQDMGKRHLEIASEVWFAIYCSPSSVEDLSQP